MISAAKIAHNQHAHASHALTRHACGFPARLRSTRTSATLRPHAHPVTWSPARLVTCAPAPVTQSPSHPVTRYLSPSPWITASLRAFGSTQLLPVVFSSTYARSNSVHLPPFALFLRYCVYSVIVQVLSGRATQAPASPFCPRARGVGRDDLDPLFEKQRPHCH